MRTQRILLLCALLLLLAGSKYLAAQPAGETSPVSAKATVSLSNITVGDHFLLTVEAVYSKDTVVQMPGPDLKLGEFELLDHHHASLSEDPQGNIVARSTYVLTAFSTGEFEIPAIALRYRVANSEKDETITTEPVLISVKSVLAADAKDIRDIKPPLEIPRDWIRLLLAFAAGAALLTVGLLLWRRHRKAARTDTAGKTPDLPPHIAALRALNRLGSSGLLDRGEVVRYHVEVSDIIRRYFAGRFGIDALEITSRELLDSLPREVSLSLPRDFLRQCDLVKFAKFEPSRSRSERVLELAYEILEATKPRHEEIAFKPSSDSDPRIGIDQAEARQAGGR